MFREVDASSIADAAAAIAAALAAGVGAAAFATAVAAAANAPVSCFTSQDGRDDIRVNSVAQRRSGRKTAGSVRDSYAMCVRVQWRGQIF